MKGQYYFDFIEKAMLCHSGSHEKLCSPIFGHSHHALDFLQVKTHGHRNANELEGNKYYCVICGGAAFIF